MMYLFLFQILQAQVYKHAAFVTHITRCIKRNYIYMFFEDWFVCTIFLIKLVLQFTILVSSKNRTDESVTIYR